MILMPLVRSESGARVYLIGYRIHHGLAGLVLCVLGAILMLHDRRDRAVWLRISRLRDA